MTMTDPIADFLTRIRNALIAEHQNVVIPTSNMKVRLAEILKDEGYISDYSVVEAQPQSAIHIDLKWIAPKRPAITKLQRESKPGQRRYVKGSALPRVRNGHGIAIISTSRGIMTGREARKQGVGGEFICSIY